ncbi:MAG: peroxiredoxin family protein [Mucilaginibacter sp.]
MIVLKNKYYSPLASFTINYTDLINTSYRNAFFLNEKPAVINVYFKANNKNELNYSSIENASPIYDITVNKVWQGLTAFMIDTAMGKENKAFNEFLEQNKNRLGSNDSLKRIFNNFYKTRLNRIMLFLKKYPNDYFSFWYFRQQVAQPTSVLKKDTAYLKEQLAYLKSVFPAKYTESIEGKELIRTFEDATKPSLKLNEMAPPFTITTIDGKKISLSELKGKSILLDFWATWCAPCVAEIPFVKQLRKNFSSDKLEIIGISEDLDLKKLIAFVKKEQMTWPNYHDRYKEITQLYGIEVYPTLILINIEGKVIYKSNHVKNDEDELPKALKALN